jgi:predicted transcriptional regulator
MTEANTTKTISVRLSASAKRALSVLSHALEMSEKDVAGAAIRSYVSQQKGKIREKLKEHYKIDLKDIG